MSDCCLTPNEQLCIYIMAKTSYIQWNVDDVRFVLDKHALLDLYCASSLKQQSVGRHITQLGKELTILCFFSPYYCMFRREVAHTNVNVFGLIRPFLKLTIFWFDPTVPRTHDLLV